MVSLFRRANVDGGNAQTEQLSQLLLRRLDFLEYDRLISFESILTEHETRFEGLAHRINLLEASANRDARRESVLYPEGSLTAGLAEDAPVWTENSNNSLPPAVPAGGAGALTPLHTLNRLEAEIVALTEPANQ